MRLSCRLTGTAFSLCLHLAFPLGRGREIAGASSSSYKDPSPIGSGPHPYDLINLNYLLIWAFQVSQTVKNLPAMPESQVKFPDREDPLEKGIVTHSSILAWRIPWTEEPDGL